MALGNGGATAFWDAAAFGLVAAAGAAPRLRGVLPEVRGRDHRRAVPRGPGRDLRRPRRRARPGRRRSRRRGGGRRRGGVGAQRDLDRRDGPRAAPGGRGRGARPDRRDLRRRAACRSTSATPTPTTSRRRRASPPTAACGSRCSSPAAPGADRRARGLRSLDPAVPVAAHGARELGQRPDLQHPGGRDAVPARRADPLDARRRRPGLVRGAHARLLRAPVRLGRARAPTRRRSSPTRPSARWSSARSTSTRPSTRRRSRRRCAPTGSSTSSPTASSVATSCGSGCSPRSTRPTCRR